MKCLEQGSLEGQFTAEFSSTLIKLTYLCFSNDPEDID